IAENGTESMIASATTNSLTITNIKSTDAGKYYVWVRNGATAACATAVKSNEALLVVNSKPNIVVNSPTTCFGNPVTVTAVPGSGSGSYTTYTWTVPSGATNPGNVASFEPKVSGNYTVSVTDSRGCTSDAVVSTVTLTQPESQPEMAILEMKWVTRPEDNKLVLEIKAVEKSPLQPGAFGDAPTYAWYQQVAGDPAWTPIINPATQQQYNGSVYIEENHADKSEYEYKAEVVNLNTCKRYNLTSAGIVPLPVELMYFKAEKRGGDVAMEWATASEQDNKGFEVQVSTDAKSFRTLGFVESHVGTTSLKQVYTFTDKENGKLGTRYYRLKQVDLDGKFEYFSTKAVSFGEVTMSKVRAYPNPFESEVELSIDAELGGEVLVTVTSATGQQLLQRTIQVARGANVEKLALDPKLPRGVYIISTRMGELTQHFKLLKQ
ncbi:MAG: T9SS type A sorting domain-containing protein, partial [Hymenobacteraceae bacterium]|nr:T9SS type A sorting domain-containing protein [Hymenobacteraceae bacterium]